MEQESNTQKRAADCIYEALIRLMDEKPYHEISITDISKRAGVSRMAYYRNYADKNEILLHRLRMYIYQMESVIKTKRDLSQGEFWKTLIQWLYDSINEYILKAGLFLQSFSILKDHLMRVYTALYGLKDDDSEQVLLIYQKLGSILGYIIYIREHKDEADRECMMHRLKHMAEDGLLF